MTQPVERQSLQAFLATADAEPGLWKPPVGTLAVITLKDKLIRAVPSEPSDHVEGGLADRPNALGLLAVDQAEAAAGFVNFLPA